MRKLFGLALLVLAPTAADAADPTVTNVNVRLNPVGDTLHIGCEITANGEDIVSAKAVWRAKGAREWKAACSLGNAPGPYRGNTTDTFAVGQKIEVGIVVTVSTKTGGTRDTAPLAVQVWTVAK